MVRLNHLYRRGNIREMPPGEIRLLSGVNEIRLPFVYKGANEKINRSKKFLTGMLNLNLNKKQKTRQVVTAGPWQKSEMLQRIQRSG
jgi:hypothetical protein